MATSHTHTTVPMTQNTVVETETHLLPVLNMHNMMTINQLMTIKALCQHHIHFHRLPDDVCPPKPSPVPQATPKYNSQPLSYDQIMCHTITHIPTIVLAMSSRLTQHHVYQTPICCTQYQKDLL